MSAGFGTVLNSIISCAFFSPLMLGTHLPPLITLPYRHYMIHYARIYHTL
jgi:hypothetical protein